jgi:hypothetical protein
MQLVFLEHTAAQKAGSLLSPRCLLVVRRKKYSILVQRVARIYVVGSTIVQL